MLLQGNQGALGKQLGQNITAGIGEFSDVLVTELQPRYYELAYRGQVFFTSVAAAAGTAYTGGAAGTPLLAIWNPPNTGKNLILLGASTATVAAASAAGQTQFRIYGGATAAITQATVAIPVSTLSLTASGSIAKAYQNVALTSSTALTYITTIGTYYWATAAAAFLAPPLDKDFNGSIIVAPGNMLALGAATIPTAMTNDASLIWAEQSI